MLILEVVVRAIQNLEVSKSILWLLSLSFVIKLLRPILTAVVQPLGPWQEQAPLAPRALPRLLFLRPSTSLLMPGCWRVL